MADVVLRGVQIEGNPATITLAPDEQILSAEVHYGATGEPDTIDVLILQTPVLTQHGPGPDEQAEP